MAFPKPGETFRLAGPWVAGSFFSFSNISWAIQLPGMGVATSADPRGWTVTLISGNYGEGNLVVDITAPANLVGTFADGSGLYDVPAIFSHGNENTEDTFSQNFNFSHTSLTSINSPEFDVVLHPHSEELYSAVLEVDGVHVYRISLRTGIGAKVEVSSIAGVSNPNIWHSNNGYFYLTVLHRATPLTDGVWRLYESRDGCRSWVHVSDLPWPPQAPATNAFSDNFAWTRGGNDVMLSVRFYDDDFHYISRSYDGGRTWSTPATDPTARNWIGLRYIEPVPGSSDWHLYRGGIAQNILWTQDLGRSWARRSFNASLYDPALPRDPNAPDRLGYIDAAFSSGHSVLMVAGKINKLNTASQLYPHLFDKLSFSRSHDWGLTWRTPTLIANDPTGHMMGLGQGPATGTLYNTNGRDRLYTSTNTGQTWEAKP